ncbi:MAG: DUF167 domain-containing protein [Promethearchaeota archaeon]
MRFLEKIDETNYILRINVKPNSKKQDIINNDKTLTIHVKSKAMKNKANKELIDLLKAKLELASHQISIVSGFKNINKILQINFPKTQKKQSLINKLLDY